MNFVEYLFAFTTLAFLATIGLHLVRKNSGFIFLYRVQSLFLVLLLGALAWQNESVDLLLIAIATLFVKAILAPLFFQRLIARHKLHFTTSSAYLNLPLTLIVLVIITLLVSSGIGQSVVTEPLVSHRALEMSASMLLISFFLMINRKGVLSQIIGVLSLENSAVFFALMMNFEQSLLVELGILFDLVVWIVVATVFVGMVIRQFGSMSTTKMKSLIEE